MVRLILGRAGTGKTSRAMEELKARMLRGGKRLWYIVPEQYSHDAERQLLHICGDRLSLHGEVLSFSRLCSRVFSETGGMAAPLLDDGGRILMMSRAVAETAGRLFVYGGAEQRVDFLEGLVATARELKSARISPEALERAALSAQGPLGDKLRDMALIFAAYDSFFGADAADPDDRLGRLARILEDGPIPNMPGHITIDGFSDFTAQEQRVVEAFIAQGAQLTVCLTCAGLEDGQEIFEPARRTALSLLKTARERRVATEIVLEENADPARHPALIHLEKNLFSHDLQPYEGEGCPVEIWRAPTPGEECEFAAARAWELVRSGLRWRDIAVAVCGFESYGTLAEHIFEKYNVPVYVSKKADIGQKPPVALLDAALDIVVNGWDCPSVFRYLKTGMAGVCPSDCDELENYALLWNLRGSVWTRPEAWTLPVSGYEPERDGDGEKLRRLDGLRRAAVAPVMALKKRLGRVGPYSEKLTALYSFMEDIRLPEQIRDKSLKLAESGAPQLADEYAQLWDIIVGALEQFHDVMGHISGGNGEFARLWRLLASRYSVASIPVSLDRVIMGDLPRLRRRGIRCLIVIGADDGRLPAVSGAGGLLSDSERAEVIRLGVGLTGTAEERLNREMALIYASLTQPTEKLIMTCPRSGFGGGERRPSFVLRRLGALFSIDEKAISGAGCRLSAEGPCLELAASFPENPDDSAAAAAAGFVLSAGPPSAAERLDRIIQAARTGRGQLSGAGADLLYGQSLKMSASRVDTLMRCRYQYFLQYGLGARLRRPAGFDAPTAGTFMHYVLENVTRELQRRGGFREADDDVCRRLTDICVDRYVEEVLRGFKDKSSRFTYLFDRLRRDAAFVVLDMVRELKCSEFAPLDFELEFSDSGGIAPYVLRAGDTRLSVKGFVDRVDGWRRDGRLYLRVVDYKTGRKKFNLSDVWYGMNMQMLIYLFALWENGAARYGGEIVPAGVLYAPAREELLAAPRSIGEGALDRLRAQKLRRSGLLLGDGDVLDAMEPGDKRYLPVKTGSGTLCPSGDSLAGPGQLSALASHIDRQLLDAADSIRRGRIEAAPYFKNPNDNGCLYCDYAPACHFGQRPGDRNRYIKKLDTADAWRLIEGGGDGRP